MAESESKASLSDDERKALFDILTHHETYQEIEDFKYPGAIHNYGPPFQDGVKSPQSPVLQALVSKFLLNLPGLKDVSPQFWKDRVEKLVQELAEAELSESYDKGVLGIRKTLATAISALIEYPARGALGGFPKREIDKSRKYDSSKPEDVLQAWRDCVQEIVYGSLLDELFVKVAETEDLGQHEPVVQGMHEFIIVNLASIMHYTLILSPEGPTMLRMIESVHNLIPYMVIRQTLKVGNVATMLSGVMKVVLAKASVASVTNWIGLSSGADEGMNLLQQIISQVLGWDKRELRKRAEKIEKDKKAPPKEVLKELKDWITRDRNEHEECRRQSREQERSIVAVILSLSSVSADLNEAQHEKALAYLSLNLAVRDRQEIVRVLCQRNPDILTAAIRDAVDAYTPMIRHVHQAVNLSDTMWDFERFVTDMLKIAKPSGPKGSEKPPSVEAFVDLLHRHQSSSHKFLHQVAVNDKELLSWWKDYALSAAGMFRSDEKPPASGSVVSDTMVTGGVEKMLDAEFARLSESDQEAVREEVNAHRKYVDDLHTASASRVSAVIKRDQATPFGPGAYLARWQQLMDDTLITPATLKGPVRRGGSKGVKDDSRKDIEGQDAGFVSEEKVQKTVGEKLPTPPKTEASLRHFRSKFKEALATG
ncbi:hypothetical protein CLAFUW4_01830 [Fulvia fulva]|uniref:Px domain containing protein n=1 Tax=Passalora fulva TaxID=5499 RepID=A0A9Q8L7P6_PASFU|nr:uncharacterized protein CLAFUR5_01825 [Fulvia fulva]KAK4634328.1 hypothetical protein CLAFUR4_01825 [Fulvia fulva]KAK4638133.1 hypothetical protein CLAFUR0_01827 [Fulvia fulva]UJO12249.1 hypothetical protein CLAFUR5_01825 [Fulvia fulva]WPV08838.1 hypothetical protein CLAFUW4_01830 [Fulvia fulva]WPV25352.1 hypothetical protein CLAFUW7_01829 [Fulvia fulva]